MKIRESGMPDQSTWENFFDPEKILKTLGLDDRVNNVVEFGCGYGTFTLPAARIIKGKIYALDIEPEMIRITNERAKSNKLNNVRAILRDFMNHGSGLSNESADYVMLFNILHLEHPEKLLHEAKRVLKKKGKLGIIHWNYDPKTPRGPSMTIRPKPEQCLKWAEDAGFQNPKRFDLKPHHYGLVLVKQVDE
ncbi:MAG TPA: class I SAM-dependent methyltransferase, partial [Candidatus Omnitrophota bacterium]|nr:class I SAM-dependent methyltransferase [Candidatus Omnitrophota bacterium]